jgi:hypothetical protein
VLATLASAVARGAAVVCAVACTATLTWALASLAWRSLDGTEGHLLFDASRIRDHLRLYVDPVQGAWDYGPVPARYYVLHLPLWAAVLSCFPAGAAPYVARALAVGAWFGLLAGIALGAPRPNRFAAWCAALFVGGAFPLALFGAAGRHDAPALLLAGVALLRSMRRGHSGPLEGALFALAALVKPNVAGAAAGVLLHDVVTRGWRAWPALLAAAAVVAAAAAGLHVASSGMWLEHLLRSTQTTPIASLWLDQMRTRLPFFAVPLAAAGWWAWRGRSSEAARVGGWALVASSAWTIWSLAKVGSASNYWMEPCVAALAIVSRVQVPRLRVGATSAAAALAFGQSLWVGVAAVRSAVESLDGGGAKSAALLEARRTCGAAPNDVVIADEVGLEMMLDGRVVQVPFAMTHLVRAGRYPVQLWREDVTRPEVRCLAMQDDLLERPLDQVHVADDLFEPQMRRVLRDHFQLVSTTGGIWLYRAKH